MCMCVHVCACVCMGAHMLTPARASYFACAACPTRASCQARLELLTRANTTEAAAPLVALIKDIASAIATLRSLQ